MKTYKILGLLLTYPDEQLGKASSELLTMLRKEAILPNKSIKKIDAFLAWQGSEELLALQEIYVGLFDRGRAHCLHLFEHVHGESRDRGQAMIDLSDMYASKNLTIDTGELPDYLPLFLEYLSLCEANEASEHLGDAIDIIAAIATKLERQDSPYAAVFDALVVLSSVKPDSIKIEKVIESSPKDPQSHEDLDAEWEDTPAFENNVDCNGCAVQQTKVTEHPLQHKVGGV